MFQNAAQKKIGVRFSASNCAHSMPSISLEQPARLKLAAFRPLKLSQDAKERPPERLKHAFA
jgi:hypothetical protein